MGAAGDDGGDVRGDARGDTTPDTRWMSYRELADFLGVEEESARRRAQRARWPRRPGNDGKARVGVPGDVTPDDTRKAARDDTGDDGGDDGGDVTPALVALIERQAAELAELRERLGRAEGDAVAVRAELERIQAAHVIELNRALADLDRERTERRAERQAAEVERARAERAEGEALALREALARETRRAEQTEALAQRGQQVAGTRLIAFETERKRLQAQLEADAKTQKEVLEREQAQAAAERRARKDAEAAREAADRELANWTAGGPVARAWRAFLSRRGRP